VGWTCGMDGEDRKVYRILVGKPEEKKTIRKIEA
jgi:hypothetical protein